MPLRVAAVQAEAVLFDVERNVDAAAGFVREAAERGASLIVFPEAFVTGYDDAVFAGALPEAGDLAWLEPVQRASDATGVVAVVNTALDHGTHRALSDVLVTPGTDAVVAYDKQQLYASERRVFEAGDHGFSFAIEATEVALSVCYDANFPEHAAAAAESGAIVYANSGAYFAGGEHRRDLHYASRALDNGMYVVFSGLVGGGFIGGSAIFDPLGRRIAGVSEREGLAIADLDPAVVTAAREQQRMWTDRRSTFGVHRRHGETAQASS